MMKLMTLATGPLLALALLAGCSADTDTSTTAAIIDKADFTEDVMYIDLAISDRPLTAAQMGDTQFATPVRVEFHNGVAAAFYAPDGFPIYSYDHVIAAWYYNDLVGVTPTVNDTVEDPTGSTEWNPSGESISPLGYDTRRAQIPGQGAEYSIEDGQIELDWILDRIEKIEALPPGWHPGC